MVATVVAAAAASEGTKANGNTNNEYKSLLYGKDGLLVRQNLCCI